ncbi:MAG: Nif3-like dinuclear metal center hexameric protein [Ruminococcaceae bacterium]|nr:Nif3-like dinuclear metal center hexameric protein [Oscillospiraceae bacterium]
MTVQELYRVLNDLIPRELSCSWDNDGVMCLPNGDKDVKKVLLSLDATSRAVEYAAKNGFDLIVTHHPLIFRPIKTVSDNRFVTAIKNDISVFSFHTRLDAVDGGVNTALSELLGLTDTERFGDDGLGVIGNVSPMTDREFVLFAKEKLGASKADAVLFDKSVTRVAVVGGDGEHYIPYAKAAGADLYISGRLSYNDMTDASDYGMSMAALGHFETENPVLNKLEKMIKDADPSVITEKFDCNVIETL